MVKGIIYIAILIAFIIGYVKYIENRVIFFPMKDIEFTPAFLGLSFEDVYIKTGDNIQINGWFIPAENAKYTLLFCHGNAGNIGHRLEKIALLRKARLNIFIIDYRGYGRSQGKPSERGIYLDARAAYDYLVNKQGIAPEDIVLYGESLGCAAAIHLAREAKAGALIVESGFSRGRDMAKRIYPFLPAFLFSDNFDNLSKIKKIKAPKLFIHSKNDEIVPLSLAKRLYSAAPQPKCFTELIGGHNTAFLDSQQRYVSSIVSFIERLSQE